MNFLQLGQRLQAECGVSGSLTTMQNQTGSLGRLVTWIGAGWQELQTIHDDWDWMLSSNLLGAGITVATVSSQTSYPLGTGAGTVGVAPANFGKWKKGTFRSYVTSAGIASEIALDDVEYDVWRNDYMLGAMRLVVTRPVVIAIGPDKSLCLGPPPDGTYTFTGDYYAAPTSMSADGDSPTNLPAQWHMAVVYKAMQMYAAYESAPEAMQRGVAGWNQLISRMEALYLPRIAFGGALV